MNELTQTKTKPVLRSNNEAAALNDLLNLMNSPTLDGSYVPPDADTKVTPKMPATNEAIAAPALTAPQPRIEKLFFTGRLKSGKDFVAAAAGAKILAFAEPLYVIASHFFEVPVSATEGKDLSGMREFLQQVGQWGRGVVSAQYPLTAERAMFTQRVARRGQDGIFGFPEVDWKTYGQNNDIWLNACIARAAQHTEGRVAITGCRFTNEFKALQAAGWTHFHVLCSPKTWAARLAASKLTPESPAVKDLSEQLAAKLDTQVIRALSVEKNGARLRAIWSDSAPLPSARLHTVETFLKSIGAA